MSQPDFQLHRNAHGHLVLTDAAGQTHAGVVPVRAYPLSAPDEGLSIVSTDGHELAWVPRVSALPAALRELIESDLAVRELTPIIRRLCSVSTFSSPSTWTVETDRGPTTFVLKGEDDIRRLGEGRLLVSSAQGMNFLVPDVAALDRASRKLFERFL